VVYSEQLWSKVGGVGGASEGRPCILLPAKVTREKLKIGYVILCSTVWWTVVDELKKIMINK